MNFLCPKAEVFIEFELCADKLPTTFHLYNTKLALKKTYKNETYALAMNF